MKLEISVEGMQDLLNSIEKVERGVLDLRDLGTWDWVEREFYQVVKEQFASEGGAGQSGKWKGLSHPYAEIKTRTYGDNGILVASGAMYRSLTGGAGAIVDKQAQEMTLGSTDKKAGWHQHGTGRMPARPIYDFTDAQTRKIQGPIIKKLRQLIDNAKLRDVRGF